MGHEKGLECPACGVRLVMAVRVLDPGTMEKASGQRWAKASPEARRKQAALMVAGRAAKRERAAEPVGRVEEWDLEAAGPTRRVVCQKCGHAPGCAERLRCRCLHRYGG